jgi:lipoprotein signal peptidase
LPVNNHQTDKRLTGKAPECREVLRWIGWACLLAGIDQITKGLIRETVLPGTRITVITDVLFIYYVQNYKSFSWFVPDLPDWTKVIFLVLRMIIILSAFPVYKYYVKLDNRNNKPAFIALVCLTAGILGNLLDDLFAPFTTDFIQVFQSPSGNLADLLSFIGVSFLIIEMIRRFKKKSRSG